MSRPRTDIHEVQVRMEELLVRIKERFPERQLVERAEAVLSAANEADEKIKWMKRKSILRTLFPILLVVGSGFSMYKFRPDVRMKMGNEVVNENDIASFLADSLTAIGIVATVAGILFVKSQQSFKREKKFKIAAELEDLCTSINHGQLPKNPGRLYRGEGENTKASLPIEMTPVDMECYLDYVSNLLSHIGAIAAHYKQALTDSAARTAFADVGHAARETTTKIWQKEIILTLYKTSNFKPVQVTSPTPPKRVQEGVLHT